MRSYVPAIAGVLSAAAGALAAWIFLLALAAPDVIQLLGTAVGGVWTGLLVGKSLARRRGDSQRR